MTDIEVYIVIHVVKIALNETTVIHIGCFVVFGDGYVPFNCIKCQFLLFLI